MTAERSSEKAHLEEAVASSPVPLPLSQSETSDDSELDDTYNVYKQGVDQSHDQVEARNVLRKIDLRIVPVLFVIYLLQYLDKNSINFASAFGFREGTGLKGQDYSWLNSIFYFGYLGAQYPAGYLMQKLPIGKFLSVATLCWGIVLMTTPACRNFAGIAVNRFILGVLEATVNPGFMLIMGIWYKTVEQPLRLESYYCTNGVATMFGGLIGFGVGHIQSGLPRWMYVFLIFGACSIVAATWSFFVLPDLPATAKFLNPRERAVAVERVAANRSGVKNHNFKKDQLLQTLYDPKTWILLIMSIGAQIPNAALTSFTSIILEGFGFGTLGTLYLQIPGGAIQFLTLIFGGWLCTKRPNSRCITMIVANTVCILGSALLVGLPDENKWGRLVAIWLCYFQSLGFSMSLTMVSSNVAGYTKKQLTGAIIFTGYCIGNIIGPQTFRKSEAPAYHSAYIAMLVGYSTKLLMVVVLYAYMWSVNKSRDKEAQNVVDSEVIVAHEEKAAIELGMHDVTELQNKGFRYAL